jgi:hypothetical protein
VIDDEFQRRWGRLVVAGMGFDPHVSVLLKAIPHLTFHVGILMTTEFGFPLYGQLFSRSNLALDVLEIVIVNVFSFDEFDGDMLAGFVLNVNVTAFAAATFFVSCQQSAHDE